MCERGRWNAAVIDGSRVAKDVIDSHCSLSSSRMRQHQLSGDVTNSPKMGDW